MIVIDLHRAQTAEVIARHLTPMWRVAGPWFLWLFFAVTFGQVGFLTAAHLERSRTWDFTRYVTDVHSGDPSVFFLTPFAPW